MKSKAKKFFAGLCSLVLAASSLVGCGGADIRNSANSESGIVNNEEVDESKTQLYVGFYYSGLGKEWIQQAKTVFEEKYSKVEFEKNKKGVQVMLDLDKAGLNGGSLIDTISSKRDQVFFIENGVLDSFVARGLVAEITDVVKGTAADSETATIESKLDANSYEYYNMNGKYYALPYYEDFVGLNYNIDLFEEKGYYFAKDKSAEGFDWENGDLNALFVQSREDEKSLGPDNKPNTDDDGLPATYADFRALLMRISSYGDIPMIWCGTYLTYLVDFMNNVWADYEGAENFTLNFKMEGMANDLIDVNETSGEVTQRAPLQISGDTGYMLQKQAGKYHALEFAKMCVSDSSYYYRDSFSSSLTHLDAQGFFINGTPNDENVAMLIDGNWWDVEATSKFDPDPTAPNSKLNRNFGSMPVPKADSSKVGEGRTLFNINKSMCFINANTSEQLMPVAKEFLRFCQSDEAINIFCQYTNMMRPMKYTLKQETLDKMSTYGNQMWKIHNDENVTFVTDFPLSDAAVKNTSLLNAKTWGWSNNDGQTNPFIAFKNNANLTAAKYFNSMYKFYDTSWGQKWVR